MAVWSGSVAHNIWQSPFLCHFRWMVRIYPSHPTKKQSRPFAPPRSPSSLRFCGECHHLAHNLRPTRRWKVGRQRWCRLAHKLMTSSKMDHFMDCPGHRHLHPPYTIFREIGKSICSYLNLPDFQITEPDAMHSYFWWMLKPALCMDDWLSLGKICLKTTQYSYCWPNVSAYPQWYSLNVCRLFCQAWLEMSLEGQFNLRLVDVSTASP
jgi:hypothetical protein